MVVAELARLRKPIATFIDFEVHPTVMNMIVKVILVDEFLRNVAKFDVDVFRSMKRSFEVEVGDVEASKLGARPGDNAVEL